MKTRLHGPARVLLAALGIFLVGISLVSGACSPEVEVEPPAPVVAGAVSSAHPLATQAGLHVLEAGGNAFDASVAVAAVLTVVEPMSSNLFGGYGTLIVHDAATGTTRYLDNNGRFPAATNSDVFRAAASRDEIMRTAQAVSTPGNLPGFELLWTEHGSLEWPELLQPAIDLAEDGVEVSAPLSRAIGGAWQWMSDYTRGFYGRDGAPLGEGELLVQLDLAESLRRAAAEGSKALVDGPIAEALDLEMTRQGGFLRVSDLEAHRSEWLEPISIDYRGVEVVTAGAPSNSFAALVCLGLMQELDTAAHEHNSAKYLHRFAEATKHAFWARLAYAGGPEKNPPPFESILSAPYWQEQAARIGDAASAFTPPALGSAEGESTTHYVVADASGNVVSATITLGHGFGSAVMVEGTGIWLNNSMAYSTYEPKGNPMDALPGARKHSSKSPVLLLRDGLPWVAIGTPGGHTIPQTTPQMIANLIDFDMTVQQAVDAPRVAFAEPDRLLVETAVPEAVRAELTERGHQVVPTPGLGLAHGVRIERDDSGRVTGFEGGADRRGVGTARTAGSVSVTAGSSGG